MPPRPCIPVSPPLLYQPCGTRARGLLRGELCDSPGFVRKSFSCSSNLHRLGLAFGSLDFMAADFVGDDEGVFGGREGNSNKSGRLSAFQHFPTVSHNVVRCMIRWTVFLISETRVIGILQCD